MSPLATRSANTEYQTTSPLVFSQNIKMGLSNITHSTTANINAGIRGLWKLGTLASNLALSWKLIEDLAEESIGVNEVEMAVWTRSVNREVKKGNARPDLEKGKYSREFQRDK